MSEGGMPRAVKVVLVVVLAVVVLYVLFTLVFPWVERQMEDPTLGAPATTGWSFRES